MDAKQAAIDLIKSYVERGDSIQQLKAGLGGSYCEDYHASISGYVGGKKYSADFIVVQQVKRKSVNAVFKLSEIYDLIKHSQLSLI